MTLICQLRGLSLSDLSLAFYDGCAVRVDRGARQVLVSTIKKISEQQIQCATKQGEEFCLCQRSVSSGSVGIDVSDPFEDLQKDLRLGDLVRVTMGNKSYSGTLIRCVPELAIRIKPNRTVEVRKPDYNHGKVDVEKLPRRWEIRSDWYNPCLIRKCILFTDKYGCLIPESNLVPSIKKGCLIPESNLVPSIMFQQPNGLYVTLSKETLQSEKFAACFLSREDCKGMNWLGVKIQHNHSLR